VTPCSTTFVTYVSFKVCCLSTTERRGTYPQHAAKKTTHYYSHAEHNANETKIISRLGRKNVTFVHGYLLVPSSGYSVPNMNKNALTLAWIRTIFRPSSQKPWKCTAPLTKFISILFIKSMKPKVSTYSCESVQFSSALFSSPCFSYRNI
jgi:hypothetical protein